MCGGRRCSCSRAGPLTSRKPGRSSRRRCATRTRRSAAAGRREGVKDSDVFVRGMTVQALGSCLEEGTAEEIAKAVLTQLAGSLRDADGRVQNVAAQLLAKEEARAVPVLIPLVEKGQGKQR